MDKMTKACKIFGDYIVLPPGLMAVRQTKILKILKPSAHQCIDFFCFI